MWILYAFFSAIFAALVAIFGKIGINNVDSTLATTVRAMIMALFLIITSFSLGKFHLLSTIKSEALIFITLSGVAGAISWLFYFLALKQGTATGVSGIDRLSIVFVLIFSVLFLSQKLTWQTSIGAILMAAGAILLSI